MTYKITRLHLTTGLRNHCYFGEPDLLIMTAAEVPYLVNEVLCAKWCSRRDNIQAEFFIGNHFSGCFVIDCVVHAFHSVPKSRLRKCKSSE